MKDKDVRDKVSALETYVDNLYSVVDIMQEKIEELEKKLTIPEVKPAVVEAVEENGKSFWKVKTKT